MVQTPVDYTLFFRELSKLPADITPLKKSFYQHLPYASKGLEKRWSAWLYQWQLLLGCTDYFNLDESSDACSDVKAHENLALSRTREQISKQMNLINPKYSLREWLLVPAYTQASEGNYSLLQELQSVMTQPYAEQSQEVEDKYYRLKAAEFFAVGGLSHLSCSS